MSRLKLSVLLVGGFFVFSVAGFGQIVRVAKQSTNLATTVSPLMESGPQATSSNVTAVVPRLMKFNGSLRDAAGKPLTGAVDVTFSLYSTESGGDALWFETQSVQADELGRYTALLGAMHADGLPVDLFTSGEVRWLGIQVGSEVEQSRVLLVSVPYALKAGDAETLGGKPASAYMLSDSQKGTTSTTAVVQAQSGTTQTNTTDAPQKAATPSAAAPLTPCASVTSDGTATANYIPLFTTACNVQNSILYQVNGKIGMGTTTPQAVFHMYGPASHDADAQYTMISTDTTTAAQGVGGGIAFAGFYSGTSLKAGFANIRGIKENGAQGDYASAIVLDTRANGGNQTERMRITSAGNVGIGTSTPAAKLEVNGTAQFDGLVTFSAGQTVTGNVSTAGQLVSSVATGTAPLSVASTTQVANLNASQLGGFASSAFAKISGGNSFSGDQGVTGIVSATSFIGSGAGLTSVPASALTGGIAVGGTGAGGITVALNGTSPNFVNGYGGNSVSASAVGAGVLGGGASSNENTINSSGNYSTIAGGSKNSVTAHNATISGGDTNAASGPWSTVGGGAFNTASGSFSTVVGGGTNNTAAGNYSSIPGGEFNSTGASADHSFAAGYGAVANHTGTFVWADNVGAGTKTLFTSTGSNQFLIRATGGVGIGTASPQATLDTAGQDRRKPVLFSTLTACSSTIEGETAAVTDSTTNTWGATIAGSGSNHVLAYCDGTHWTVAAL